MMPSNALWVSLPIPTLMLDGSDRIVQSNPAAESFLNVSARALEGAPIWTKLICDASLHDAYARAREGRTSLSVNNVEIGVSPEATPCNVEVAPLSGDTDLMLVMIVPREINGRMVQQSGAGKAAKSAIGMAEMLAHEIKNPLAGITGAAQLVAMNLTAQDQELTDLIVAECRRIVALLDQVEHFGNLRPSQRRPVNIHDSLDRARHSASVGFGRHMTFLDDYDPSLPVGYADADQLQQIFQNLLKNAAEAGKTGGQITLRTFYDAGLRVTQADGTRVQLPLQIEIIDNGPGLPASIADHIFDPFVSGRENGTGLGLALVSKLIHDGGGWITVDSVPGRTAFRISLPLAPEHDGDA